MRNLILSAGPIAVALATAPVMAAPAIAPPQQVATLVQQDTAPRARTTAVQSDAPVERVDRPIVRTRRPDDAGLLRRELALLSF